MNKQEPTSSEKNDKQSINQTQAQHLRPTHEAMAHSLALEPTPIDTHRMIPVENFPLLQASWNGDDRLLASLQGVFMSTQGSHTHDPMSSASSGPANFGSPSSFPATTGLEDDKKPSSNYASRVQSSLDHALPDSSAIDQEGEQLSLDHAIPGSSTLDQVAASAPSRSTQLQQWNLRYQELVQFLNENKHCSVPLHYARNPSLAHWVKRQRNQYRMKLDGKHSTLTADRQEALDKLGFIWDSQAAAWDERWNQLLKFHEEYGHSRVPKNYPPNQQLVGIVELHAIESTRVTISRLFAFSGCMGERPEKTFQTLQSGQTIEHV
eukprot:scaffold2068_cov96-Cylindrotheca_fusiformis.AAC.6